MRPFRPRGRATAAVLAALASACAGPSDAEAVAVVRTFDQRLIEAYRTGDATVVEGVAGDEQANRILGLVGVKLDQGVSLDAELLDLRVRSVERRSGAVAVTTEERWHYADRRIGTGERVGEDSTDRYVMRYTLRRHGRRWLVDDLEFAEPPEVGRTRVMNSGSAAEMHGLLPRSGGGPEGSAPP